MSIVIRPGRLRQELARRGLAATDLAKRSGLSPATISAALAGRPISARSLQLMATTLVQIPPIDVIDSLLLIEDDQRSL
jgi:transcriptional regulator with XRE-family HTH domain